MNNILYYKYRNKESYHISRGSLNSEVKRGKGSPFRFVIIAVVITKMTDRECGSLIVITRLNREKIGRCQAV